MLATALAVKMSSDGPILFRQRRTGHFGCEFIIYKFRTMHANRADRGPLVTKDGDSRLTAVGRILRRTKLDELPQLLNVLRGDMSMVGPRPKVPEHQVRPLAYRPGITGAATIAFRNEEEILRNVPDEHLHDYQVRVMMPVKHEMDESYMSQATFLSDLTLLAKTLLAKGEPISPSNLNTGSIEFSNDELCA